VRTFCCWRYYTALDRFNRTVVFFISNERRTRNVRLFLARLQHGAALLQRYLFYP